MKVVTLGMSNKTAAIELRERFAFDDAGLPDALEALRSMDGVRECVILSTCNRVEIYASIEGVTASVLAAFLCQYHGVKECVESAFYVHENEEALRHLSHVAAGLDSAVIGEPQIFGQVKEAYRIAMQAGTVGDVLRTLFPLAFGLVKKVRSSTGIGRANVSVSYAAVHLARQTLGTLKEKTVIILGAGEMGELILRNLVENGVREIFVANRTFERARRLAASINGTPIALGELAHYFPRADILINSLASTSWVIERGDLEDGVRGRRLMVIDISVPRAVNPNVATLPGVCLHNIDDLKTVADESLAMREREAKKAADMIGERIDAMFVKVREHPRRARYVEAPEPRR